MKKYRLKRILFSIPVCGAFGLIWAASVHRQTLPSEAKTKSSASKSKAQLPVSTRAKTKFQPVPESEEERKNRLLWDKESVIAYNAYKARNYPLSISTYKVMQEIGGIPQATAMFLARPYAKLGMDMETYKALHIVLYPTLGSGSSYGSLCERLGYDEEARKAYVYACQCEAKVIDVEPITALLKAINADDYSIKEIRSAALSAAALMNQRSDNATATEESEAAVALDPDSALARLAYVEVLELQRVPYEKIEGQAWMAQQVADGSFAPLVEKFRIRFNLYYSVTHVVFNAATGAHETHSVKYSPSTPVPTPSFPRGFSLSLPED
jgi:hypothetical protein